MISYREATPQDADILAQMHTQSWRHRYRGILLDAYLEKEVEADRLRVWRERLGDPSTTQHIVIAMEGKAPAGFACIYAQHDPQWGALLDNLHVLPAWQGRGIGRALMDKAARWVNGQAPDEGLYLWVYEQNEGAISFYERAGGVRQEVTVVDNPGGGQGTVWRYVWPTPQTLFSSQES